jgi:N-glycosylase/DNA lyase
MSLVSEVKELRKSPISRTIKKRLSEFKALGERSDWFSELCFCILTANSKASTALNIQQRLGSKGFARLPKKGLASVIRGHKHRFHNTKAGFIVDARRFRNIKNILMHEKDPRRWLVENIKGIGWKEASHFLRNIGYTDYAILDRHILDLMLESRLIKKKPKNLNENNYIDIEKKLQRFGRKVKMSMAELDLYLWFMKTGKVLK